MFMNKMNFSSSLLAIYSIFLLCEEVEFFFSIFHILKHGNYVKNEEEEEIIFSRHFCLERISFWRAKERERDTINTMLLMILYLMMILLNKIFSYQFDVCVCGK